MDCTQEGRNYVNPFHYDPKEVLEWYESETGANESYPFEDRRNLGLIPS